MTFTWSSLAPARPCVPGSVGSSLSCQFFKHVTRWVPSPRILSVPSYSALFFFTAFSGSRRIDSGFGCLLAWFLLSTPACRSSQNKFCPWLIAKYHRRPTLHVVFALWSKKTLFPEFLARDATDMRIHPALRRSFSSLHNRLVSALCWKKKQQRAQLFVNNRCYVSNKISLTLQLEMSANARICVMR